jgi:hypothetical protein
MNDATELVKLAYGFGRQTVPQGRWRRRLRKAIHFFHIIDP